MARRVYLRYTHVQRGGDAASDEDATMRDLCIWLAERALLVVFVLFAAAACGDEGKQAPEDRILEVLERAEAAAEANDVRAFDDLISDAYRDAHGHGKNTALLLLNQYLSTNRSIHLFTRRGRITFPEKKRSNVAVYVAMTGRAISGAEELGNMRADIFRFDIELAEEGAGIWRVTRASWRRIQLSDFL
jgi:hypothetical protein